MHNERYLHNFSIIHRYSIMGHMQHMCKSSITGHQMGYITYIYKNPAASQEELAGFFRIDKGAVAKGIKKLMNDGFVEKKRSETDRRAYMLFLTEKGQNLVAELEAMITDFNNTVTKGMTDEEAAVFDRLLNKACLNILEASGELKEELLSPVPPAPPCIEEDN